MRRWKVKTLLKLAALVVLLIFILPLIFNRPDAAEDVRAIELKEKIVARVCCAM